MQSLRELLVQLADRDARRSEATIQADVRALLLTAPFNLFAEDVRDVSLESPVGDRRRIDVESGTTVFEVKRDLRRSGVLADALSQLAGYVEAREQQTERRYVGVLTDGADWRCYHLVAAGLQEASMITVHKEKPDPDALVAWLEGVLATAQAIPATPNEIAARLGARSSAHALDYATLESLYLQHKERPEVRIKRQLWALLLTTALGSQFEDRDDLFVEHTLLVNTAEIIAHAVLGLDVALLSPSSLVSGAKFAEHGIHGLVESDFFDWVVGVARGDLFLRTLAGRLARFDWRSVEHDVLKVLYQSVIAPETRKKLGEYYTPDWLAERMVAVAVQDPLQERVLDPACGSGTFLFHAIRRYLAAADVAAVPPAEALRGVSSHVLGMDLHPVAVTLARVTYVLAIGPRRLAEPARGAIHIPVYLGDSMQWQQKNLELYSAGYLVIQVDEEPNLFSVELRFPEGLLNDARRFDELVEDLARKATSRAPGSPVPTLRATFQRLAIREADQGPINATFRAMCRLHDEGRDHIWGYYVRNLARPLWLAQPQNRVDLVIGNPPWLAFRHMTREMQARFQEMSDERGLWQGAKVATHQDLSGLFIARVVELYLRTDGRFALVVPNAALDRAQFAGFRTGDFSYGEASVCVAFETPWDLRRLRPHFFPRGSAVAFGTRADELARAMPVTAETWTGRLERGAASWNEVASALRREVRRLTPTDGEEVRSPYHSRFRQGATVVPRVLFLVEERPPGPLGLQSGMAAVRSVRSAYEKRPWRALDSLDGVVESEFVYPLLLGEHVLAYRTLPAARAVIPCSNGRLMDGDDPRLDLYPGLARWWRRAEGEWRAHRSSDRLSLVERLDFHGELTAQFPLQPSRVVYAKSGMHLAAAWVTESRHVMDHKLYWATAVSAEEALFLCAVLNSAEVTRRARPFMSYGKDERDFDKHLWRLPIPVFNAAEPAHRQLASLAAEVKAQVEELPLGEGQGFVALRKKIRLFLADNENSQRIERMVGDLLS